MDVLLYLDVLWQMAAPRKARLHEYALAGNTAGSTDLFWIHYEWNSIDNKSENLDLDSLDFNQANPF